MSNYLTLVEAAISKYTYGGFNVGDVIKFVSGYKSTESYKGLNQSMKDGIQELINTGLNIRVVENKLARNDGLIEIAADNGGGRLTHHITIPTDLFEEVENDGINLPALPKVSEYKSKVTLKPEAVPGFDKEITDQTHKDGKDERELKNTNKKIPSKEAKGTENYLKGLKNY